MRLDKYEEAIEKFKEALKRTPGYANAWIAWNYSLIELGRINEARELKEEAKKHGVIINPEEQ